MNFAQNLKRVMDEKQFTKYRLSKMLDVHQTTVKNWLDGKTEPKFEMIEKIADALGVSTNDLLILDTVHLPSITSKDSAPKELQVLRFDESPEKIVSVMKEFFTTVYQIPSSDLSDLSIDNIKEVADRINTITESRIKEENILSFYRSLNLGGKLEALKRVEELTKIEKYIMNTDE